MHNEQSASTKGWSERVRRCGCALGGSLARWESIRRVRAGRRRTCVRARPEADGHRVYFLTDGTAHRLVELLLRDIGPSVGLVVVQVAPFARKRHHDVAVSRFREKIAASRPDLCSNPSGETRGKSFARVAPMTAERNLLLLKKVVRSLHYSSVVHKVASLFRDVLPLISLLRRFPRLPECLRIHHLVQK